MNSGCPPLKTLIFSAILLAAAGGSSADNYDMACGPLKNAYGPFDFRSDKDKLEMVEKAHFTPNVENLVKGENSYIGGDLDYTLRAFPNHHRALMALVRYGEKRKSDHPSDSKYSIDCYFSRALKFKPDDGMVRMIYATFLSKKGKNNEALEQLNRIQESGDDDANLNYNLGLVYFSLQNFEKSLVHAQRAYQQGFPLPGLRDKLKRAGKWKDPAPMTLPPVPSKQEGAPASSGQQSFNPASPPPGHLDEISQQAASKGNP